MQKFSPGSRFNESLESAVADKVSIQKTCANEALSYPRDLGCASGTITCLCGRGAREKLRTGLKNCMDEYCGQIRGREREIDDWLAQVCLHH